MSKKKIFLFFLFLAILFCVYRFDLVEKVTDLVSDRNSAPIGINQKLLPIYNDLKVAVGRDFIKSIENIEPRDFKVGFHEFKSTTQDKTYKITLNESSFYAGTLMYKKEFKFTKEDIDHFFYAVDNTLDYLYLDYIFDHYSENALLNEKFDCVLNLYLLNRFKKYLILVDRAKINAILMRVKKELKNIDDYSTLKRLEVECLLPSPMIDVAEIKETFLKLCSPLEFKKLTIPDYSKGIYLVDLMRQHLGYVDDEMMSFLQKVTQKLAMLLEPDGCLPLIFGNDQRRNYRYEIFLANKYLSDPKLTFIANGGLQNYKGSAPDNLVYEDEELFSYRTNWDIANIRYKNNLSENNRPFMATYNRISNRLSLYGYNRPLLLIQFKKALKDFQSKIEDLSDEIIISIGDLKIRINKESEIMQLEADSLVESTAYVYLSKVEAYKDGVLVDKIERYLTSYNEYTAFISKPKFTVECLHSDINENEDLHKYYHCSFVIHSNKLTITRLDEEKP